MEDWIVYCPSCNSPLLSDTIQCPHCEHVLKPEMMKEIPAVQLHSEQDDEEETIPCPDCGEKVRKELVRCWQCGAFLRPEIAQTYQKMQAAQAQTLTPPADAETGADESDVVPVEPPAGQSSGGGFELATPTAAPQQPAPPQPTAAGQTTPAAPAPASADTVAAATAEEQPAGAAAEPQTYAVQPASPPPGATAQPSTGTPVAGSEPASAAPTAASTDAAAAAAPPSSAEAPPEGAPATPDQPAAEPAAAGQAAEPAPSDQAAAQTPAGEGDVPHSVATGGDALLNIAMQEEREAELRRKARGQRRAGRRTLRGGFIIFCPNGHQIEVQERHRGMTGRCPRCRALFIVPLAEWQERKKEEKEPEAAAAEQAAPKPTGEYVAWLQDVHIHRVDPQKLKLKPGSLQDVFETVDVGFAKDKLTLVRLVKKGGLFGAAEKKKPEVREAMLQGLAEGKSLDDLPVGEHYSLTAEQIRELAVVQPAPYPHESMFAGIPVFGEGRIAVRLPQPEGQSELMFASFALSEFRQFSRQLDELYGIRDFGAESGVPLENSIVEAKCHYTDHVIRAVDDPQYYQADPAYKIELAGWRCQGCGLVVSEDARKKERIGGKSGKGIAKAKCPKCGKPFGYQPLYALADGPDVNKEEQ